MKQVFDYIVNGGDELALAKAQLEHTSHYLGVELDENERLRAALLRIDAINDNPACYNSQINDVIEALHIQNRGECG